MAVFRVERNRGYTGLSQINRESIDAIRTAVWELEKPGISQGGRDATENPTQLNKDIQRTDLPTKEKSNMDLQSTHSYPFPKRL